jgi:hypothetical protein
VRPVLQLAIESLPIERVSAEVAVITHFETDRPLRGEAGRADWRLCGMLSDLLQSGRLRGAAGDAALVPSFGRLRTPRLLLLGLGASAGFGAVDVKNLSRAAVVRLAKLRVTNAALALPGHWSGLLPAGPCAGAVVRGAVAGLEDTGASLRLRLLVPDGAAARALGGIDAAIRQLGESTVTVQLASAEPVSLVGGRPPAAPVRVEAAAQAAPRL